MYTNRFLQFSRIKRIQPRWQFPEKQFALWEVRERRTPQPDWDFQTRPLIREMYRPKPPQPAPLPRIHLYEGLPPKRGRYL